MKNANTLLTPIQENVESTDDLSLFLYNWDIDYHKKIKDIDLFNKRLTRLWATEQMVYFIKVFYHARGYFRDFLWFLGNFAPDEASKKLVLENIAEEFNGNNLSHEQLYFDFARQFNVDLTQEIFDKQFYLPKMQEFNEAHVRWLFAHDWDGQLSAFSAYERLDTVDYELLSGLVEPEHDFFRVHREAEHFDKTFAPLKKIWLKNSEQVKGAFDFISDLQSKMWEDLSDAVFNYKA